MIRTKIITARSIIVASKLPDADYVINPYVGCSFACGYCYASFMGRMVGEPIEAWGDYLYVKANAVELFAKEIEGLLRRRPQATLMMSSVTDAWQGPEKKHRLARGVLRIVAERRYPGLVSLLTKSPLVLRDLDLIAALPRAELGVTVTSAEDAIGHGLEARAPAMADRFEVLRQANLAGVETYAFVGPLLPHHQLWPDQLEAVFRRLAEVGTRSLYIETLNASAYIRRRLEPQLADAPPEVRATYHAPRRGAQRLELEASACRLAAKFGLVLRRGKVLDHSQPN